MTDHWLGDSRAARPEREVLPRLVWRKERNDKATTGKWQNYKLVNCRTKFREHWGSDCVLVRWRVWHWEARKEIQTAATAVAKELCDNVEAIPKKNFATATIRQQPRQQHRKLLRTHFSHKLQCRKAKRLTSLLLMAQITTTTTTAITTVNTASELLMEGSRTTV